jgi:chemosensory pili system protein ChpA (sensor histidine kinase/response regulator)
MMNSDPQATPAIDNWFENDREGLFHNLESAGPPAVPENLDEFNDLMDFFDDEPPASVSDFGQPAEILVEPEGHGSFPEAALLEETGREDLPQRMVLSFDSAEAELEALFDTADEADVQPSSTDPYETANWLDIDHLMSEPSLAAVPASRDDFENLDQWFDQQEVEQPIDFNSAAFATRQQQDDGEILSALSTLKQSDLDEILNVGRQTLPDHSAPTPLENELDDLRELLGIENEAPAPVASPIPVQGLIPMFYDSLEQWEGLLEQSASLPPADLFNPLALETLLNAPAQVAQSRPVPLTPPMKPALATVAAPREEIEDDFKDLEALLEQADRTMGGPPAMAAVGGQRFQSRSRATKTNKVFEQTMRVPVKQLDNLSNLIGELVVKRNRLEQDQERLRQFLDNLLNQTQNLSEVGDRMHDLHERTLLEGALLASRQSSRYPSKMTYPGEKATIPGANNTLADQPFDALEMDRFTGFHLLSQEMIELIVRVRESASDIQYLVDETDQLARSLRQVTTQLQEGMTQSRMVPFAQTADRLPRAIREVSLKLNKKVNLEVEGREVLIDKMILEQLYNPMTHLVNNAITHGIETPEVRRQLGKPSEGKLSVKAFLQGNQTLITVADDGAGIDAERVKRKAIEKGLITPLEAKTMNKQDVYDLLFHAGFSTKDKADDFAGRGVGLDVVRTGLLEIRGGVTVDSTLGKGTSFTIRLPITLSICKALCCLSERARIAFPMDGVEDTKDYLPSEVLLNEEGQKCVVWNDQPLPIHPLGALLSYNRILSRGTVYGGAPEDDSLAIVILRGGSGNLLALQVDQVLGEEEIVIKQIEGPVPKPPGIAGATVRGDGSIMPIGDVLELMEIAQGRIRTDSSGGLWRKTLTPASSELQLEPTVLIVDDSITVRELLSLSFSKAGYRVEQARDGREALEKLKSGLPCDLVFCDIEMPRMNGLELLSQLQSDENLAAIPLALLTSRGADRHRQMAAKLGASGYFTKPYTEKDLLDAASRMLQGEILLPGSVRQSNSVLSRFKQAKLAAPEAPPSKLEVPESHPPRVLIIDDSVMVREMLSLTFRKANYITETARDGQDAWEKLRSGLPCDLILCDIEMPRMNGMELLDRLQEDTELSQIPIAMITSRGAQKMQRLAAEKGAKGYFVKPYIEEALLEASQRLLAGEVLLDINALVED